MVNVGIAGIGFMGWIHWLAYGHSETARVSAIWSRDPKKRAGDWRGIQGNFGPPGEQIDLTGVSAYEDLDEMLADPDVDLIDVCLPPHLHVETIERAFAAGKHVFCEKPLTVAAEEAAHLVELAEQSGRQLLVGHVLPYFPEFAFLRNAVASHEYGRLLGGHFTRIISDPTWLSEFYHPEKTGGPLIDLHVHDTHFIRLLFGMPSSVYSAGRMRGDVVEYCDSIFKFPDKDHYVSTSSGVINQQGRPFAHGFEVHFEHATLQFEFAGFTDQPEAMPLKVLHADGSISRPKLGDGDPVHAFGHEIDEVVHSIESGQSSKILSGVLARDAIVLCHKQTESVKSGREVSISSP